MPKPRTLIGAWQEMREIHRKQQEDPTYQYDTPLPPTAGGAGKAAKGEALVAEDCGGSIGDLAPGGLR